jgi:predicted DNA-binding transcriptional regulator YafY
LREDRIVPGSTTERSLELLGLLQRGRVWPGPQLAERLGVSQRVLRRDIDRLRVLGYGIEAARGRIGGYRLTAAVDLPPLVFTADEAVALALGLRTAVTHVAVDGIGDAVLGAFAKLEQVLPSRLRPRIRALQDATHDDPVVPVAAVDADVLAGIALACRDAERLTFRYRKPDGEETRRLVEPGRLLQRHRRWYLDAWDLDRDGWRTFRLDRISDLVPTGRRCEPRELPDATELPPPTPSVHARIHIDAPLNTVRDSIGPHTTGPLAADGCGTIWDISSTTVEQLAAALVWLPWPFEVRDSPELFAFLADFHVRLRGALNTA